MKKIKKYYFIVLLLLLLLIKIIIVEVQPINIEYTMRYDDQLMVEMANNIINGEWLGQYNSKTLIKGVLTPLFIVVIKILNIPFILAKEIFYGVACIILIMILKKKINSKIALIITYVILLINPVEYSAEMSRVYRDGIYMSLLLYLISFSFGIFFSRKESIKTQVKYFIGFGISFSAMYLCREENIWLLPFIIIMILATTISIIFCNGIKYKVKRLTLFMIPIAIFIISVNLICIINYKYYGIYTVNQYWGNSFKQAYGALTRIKPEKQIDRVPVTRDVIKRVYKISPKFAELEKFFEGEERRKMEEMWGEY